MKQTLIILSFIALSSIACLTGPDSGGGGGGGGDWNGGGACCKECGHNSQPCGDTCISNDKTCHTSGGCAC
jgi:hypothetical protein